jgi:hypothetical protein
MLYRKNSAEQERKANPVILSEAKNLVPRVSSCVHALISTLPLTITRGTRFFASLRMTRMWERPTPGYVVGVNRS